jgi:hypothetical protein
MELTCNDFDGCEGHCLPVGFEIRFWPHQSSPDHLSVFEVERFHGNFRRNRHFRGTVAYRFRNYDLRTGTSLVVRDVFPRPASIRLFWALVDERLADDGDCPSNRLMIDGRRVGRDRLSPDDLILTAQGATVALWNRDGDGCRSRTVDLSVDDLLEIGASPALWGR